MNCLGTPAATSLGWLPNNGGLVRIDMYWYRHPSGRGNFGDELSPWIVKALAPRADIKWVDPTLGQKPLTSRVARLLKSQVMPAPGGYDLRYSRWHALRRGPALLAIGSIMRQARRSNISVWGAGIMTRHAPIGGGEFFAVRGPRTRERLSELGFKAPEAMGDPALLAPLFFKKSGTVTSEVTLIPHFQHHELFRSTASRGVRVLDLTDSVENVLQAIAESKVTLSTSLHGVIVSHAFGVPSLWISTSEVERQPLTGDGVKFSDYFGSVGIDRVEPVAVGSIAGLDTRALKKMVDTAFGATLPAVEQVVERQRDLLLTVPFRKSSDIPLPRLP